jgi:hypothetical protein
MKKVISRIKTMFSEELLRYCAAICDTKRFESNNKKMIVLCDLLYSKGVKFEILGGATNRIALQIDGYAVKFAMDEQGYQDNLIEYALSPELQPFVTKSYETNGYIQVQECVEKMTPNTFRFYKVEILKILDTLCQDYLLGDVGYLDKNMTNWGIRDGKPVILDYAYCHRATEGLFTCSRCGSPLKYDSYYDKLICSDRSSCKAVFTYNDRKNEQGNEVDIDMINERGSESIKLSKGEISKDIEMFEDRLLGDNYIIINNPHDMYKYRQLKEDALMQISINGGEEMSNLEERFSAMIDLAKNPNDARAKKIIMEVDNSVPEPIFTEEYTERYVMPSYSGYSYDDEEEEETIDHDDYDSYDMAEALSRMIEKSKVANKQETIAANQEAIANEQLSEYLSEKEPIIEEHHEYTGTVLEKVEEFLKSEELIINEKSEVITEEPEVVTVYEPEPEHVTGPVIDAYVGPVDMTPVNTAPTTTEPVILVNGTPISLGQEVSL